MRARIEFNSAANPSQVVRDAGPVMACGTASGDSMRIASINIEKYSRKLEERATGTAFVDVREPDEYGDAHIPGTVNIPVSDLALHLSELGNQKRIYMNCLGGGRSSRATKTLTYIGFADVVIVSGGYKAWAQAGFPIVQKSSAK